MPSPFPGMDPYLEGIEWTSVHANLIEEMGRQLGPQLRPKYFVRSVRRYVMDFPDEISDSGPKTYPDIGISNTLREVSFTYRASFATMPPSPLQIPTVMSEKVPITSLEIRDATERELISAIELMSPTNKRGRGYREYLEKRDNILQSPTHLLEIDLLRAGRRVPMQQALPDASYFVFLSRTEKRPMLDVWPIYLNMPLPIIPVPLVPGDADVTINLQAALNKAYDAFGYDLSVDYSQPPEIPLVGETAVWATELLKKEIERLVPY